MVAQATSISQLPVQLLACILAVLKPAERLSSAALVATAWRTAAVLGTHDIELSEAVPTRFDSLSAWLATYSHASITNIDVTMPYGSYLLVQMPVLQLPSLQRLPGLECLHCYGVAITTAQASSVQSNSREATAQTTGEQSAEAEEAEEAAPAAPLLPLELSPATSLTALQLYSCKVTVNGLAALTRLQSLTIGGPLACSLPAAVTSNFSTQLQQALPKLQALTFLRLFGKVAHDNVLQHVSSLPLLQELTLGVGMFTLASFQQLPQSLTQLTIEWARSNTTSKKLTASTAPGLCQLTGLQGLTVRAGAISLDLVATLTSLNSLDFGCVALEGPGTLSVLTALTKLTYMHLPPLDAAVMPRNDELAAVTASPQLQVLNIACTWLTSYRCTLLFPAGRQLLQLTRLSASMDQIRDGRTGACVATCCPNLETIILSRSLDADRVVVEHHSAEADLVSMLSCWQSLQHLTSLTMEVQELPMSVPEVWPTLAHLTQLRVLRVNINLWQFAGVLQLTSCTRLQSLCVDASTMGTMAERVLLDVTGEEAGDGSTSLAHQLPQALQQAILQQTSENTRTPDLTAVLVRCAAEVQKAQEQQLAQQQGEIILLQMAVAQQQQEMAMQQGQIAEHQEQMAQLRQELKEVQAILLQQLQRQL